MSALHYSNVLPAHRQLEDWSCSLSAFEFVAKLYGLIGLDIFPLQSDPANQRKGFVEPSLLADVGLKGSDDYYDVASAVTLIQSELTSGRHTVVSLLTFQTMGLPAGYHIYVAVDGQQGPCLVDPATRSVLAVPSTDLSHIFAANSARNPERKTIHVLTLYPNAEQNGGGQPPTRPESK